MWFNVEGYFVHMLFVYFQSNEMKIHHLLYWTQRYIMYKVTTQKKKKKKKKKRKQKKKKKKKKKT